MDSKQCKKVHRLPIRPSTRAGGLLRPLWDEAWVYQDMLVARPLTFTHIFVLSVERGDFSFEIR